MRNVRWTLWAGACVAATSFALAGCASEVSDGTTETIAQATAPEVSVANHAKGCSPLECCFPDSGGGWIEDPLEDKLRAIGCSTPSAYEERADRFWSWTECPFDLRTIVTVAHFAGTPYGAHFVENPCLHVDPGQVAVVFDPTCPTCRVQPVPE